MGNKSLYYLTCVLFYIVAIINFFNSDTTTGAVWLCSATALTYLRIVSGNASTGNGGRSLHCGVNGTNGGNCGVVSCFGM